MRNYRAVNTAAARMCLAWLFGDAKGHAEAAEEYAATLMAVKR